MFFMNRKHKVEKKCALIDDHGNFLSYKQLCERVDLFAQKISSDDVVLLEMSNTIEAVIIYLACLYKRAPVIIVSKGITEKEVEKYQKRFKITWCFLCSGCMHINSITKKSNSSVALLLPTSGTTQISKLVKISRDNLLDNTKNIVKSLKISDNDVAITSLPLSYTYGLSVLNTHLYAHATVLLTEKSVIQKSFWKFAKEHRATSFAGVPYTYELLTKYGYLLGDFCKTITNFTQAGGCLSYVIKSQWIDFCDKNKKSFTVMYGQTEATARMTVMPWKDLLEAYLSLEKENKSEDEYKSSLVNSVGKPIAGGKIKVDKQGQIIYYGKNVSMGYCKSYDDLTREDENKGILHTGDYGHIDERGYVYIEGRKSDFVKICGKRICLESVKQVIQNRYEIEVLVKCDNNRIVIISESGVNREAIDCMKKELFRYLSIPPNSVLYKSVDKFIRTESGKIKK